MTSRAVIRSAVISYRKKGGSLQIMPITPSSGKRWSVPK